MGYWLKRASGWYYSAVNVLRPRSTSDRVILGATDRSASAAGGSLSVDVGSNNVEGLAVRGTATVSLLSVTGATVPAILLAESANNLTCTLLTSASGTLSNAGIYVKSNQLVIAHVCGANGTIQYLTITLDGLSCAWVQSSSAP